MRWAQYFRANLFALRAVNSERGLASPVAPEIQGPGRQKGHLGLGMGRRRSIEEKQPSGDIGPSGHLEIGREYTDPRGPATRLGSATLKVLCKQSFGTKGIVGRWWFGPKPGSALSIACSLGGELRCEFFILFCLILISCLFPPNVVEYLYHLACDR